MPDPGLTHGRGSGLMTAEEMDELLAAQAASLDSSDSDGGLLLDSDSDDGSGSAGSDGSARRHGGGAGGLQRALRPSSNPAALLSWLSLAAVFALQPPGRRVPPTLDLAAFTLEYNLLVFPLLAQALRGSVRSFARVAPRCARAAAKLASSLRLSRPLLAADRALAQLQRVSLEGVASVGLVIVLALPLLAGTPVPITVLMEGQWAPAFTPGDVLLVSGKTALTPGGFAMYRDVGSAAALRAGNASTCLGQLLALRCGAEGAAPCTAPPPPVYVAARSAPPAEGAPTHAVVLRRARQPHAPGAPTVPCPPDVPPAVRAEPEAWECAAVPLQLLLGEVGVRVPRAAWPAVPLFAARRAALAARPPRVRLVPHLAAAARAAGWDARLAALAAASEAAASTASGGHGDAHARAACEAARAAAVAARAEAETAAFWRRAAAVKAAQAAEAALAEPDGPCARAAAAAAAVAQPGAATASWLRLPWTSRAAE